MRKLFIRLCVWTLGRLVTVPESAAQPREVEMKTLATLYQTQAVREYLDRQETYIIRMAADALAEGHIPDSKFFAGRLKEIRSFRDKLTAAYIYTKRDTLTFPRNASLRRGASASSQRRQGR